MSFSNPTPATPVKRTFKWAGSTGDMTWYDKDNKERKKLDKPFKFIVLDELSAISGYSKELESGIWSNEVRNTKEGILDVKAGKAVIVRGTYAQIKDSIKSKGGKYTRAVYVLFEDEDKSWKVGKIMMAGSALGAWFDFRRDFSPDEVGVSLTGAEPEENGSTKFFVPVFKPFDLDDKLRALATETDEKLQSYFKRYATTRTEEPANVNYSPEPAEDEPDTIEIDDVDDLEPIDLSEIPF